MRYTTSVVDSGRQRTSTIPLPLGEILARIERRLAWYGLPQSSIRALEAYDGDHVVITLEVEGNGTFREEHDRWTGSIRRAPARIAAE
jgi:hypothetical protein